MTNEVAVRPQGYIANTADYYAALAAEAETYKGGGNGCLFLKFNGNDGYYSYGADDTDLYLETLVAMDPHSFQRGWICWLGGQVKEEVMLSIVEGQPPAKHMLTDHGPYGKDDGWQEQKTIEFTTIGGDRAEDPESGLKLLFQANNSSKMKALEALIKDFGRAFQNHPGMVPIVEINERSFEAQPKDGGRKVTKHAPVFKIIDWMSHEKLLTMSQGAPEDYEEGVTDDLDGAQQALPAPEPEPAPEAPRGGRRTAPAAEAPAPAPAPARGRAPAAPAQARPAAEPARPPQRGRRF